MDSELKAGLGSIKIIKTYLKVHRTYGMRSLEFFSSLTNITGETLLNGKFTLYILENNDLETLWGKNQTVFIINGRVFFHFNAKLCYSTIDAIRPMMKNSTSFDENEVAKDSNGLRGTCNTEVLNVTVSLITKGSVLINITNPIRFHNNRTFIGYQFLYQESINRNASKHSYKPCDDSWILTDPQTSSDIILTNLKPYTQYAVYVKTMTISTETRSGESEIIYFRTKPDQPSFIRKLEIYSNNTSDIVSKTFH